MVIQWRGAGRLHHYFTQVFWRNVQLCSWGNADNGIAQSVANQFPDAIRAIHLTDVGYPNETENWRNLSLAYFADNVRGWLIPSMAPDL